MANQLFLMEAALPQLRKDQNTKEALRQVMDYLIQLQEQLRYTLNNLGRENFNDAEVEKLGEDILSGRKVQSLGEGGTGVVMEDGDVRFFIVEKGKLGAMLASMGAGSDGGLCILTVDEGPLNLTAAGLLTLLSRNGGVEISGERIELNGEVWINGQLYSAGEGSA